MSMGDNIGGVDGSRLRAFVERIEKVHEVRDETAADLSDIYKEAKGNGFDSRVIKTIVTLRRKDPNKRREEAEILDLYLHALGMVD